MPLNIDWQQILLHLFNFLILFAGLWVLLYKPVRDFMRKRRSEYEQQDAEAQKKQQDAEALHAQYEQQLADMDRDAEEKRAALQKEMDGYAELRRRSAQAEADAILQKAREQAAREKEKRVRDARREIAAIAPEAAVVWPVKAFVDEIGGTAEPKTRSTARPSDKSLFGVPVPCAFI